MLASSVFDRGLGLGVLVSGFLFGFRHGIDWDHIAAITDITSSQDDRRQGVVFGTIYAAGHALADRKPRIHPAHLVRRLDGIRGAAGRERRHPDRFSDVFPRP